MSLRSFVHTWKNNRGLQSVLLTSCGTLSAVSGSWLPGGSRTLSGQQTGALMPFNRESPTTSPQCLFLQYPVYVCFLHVDLGPGCLEHLSAWAAMLHCLPTLGCLCNHRVWCCCSSPCPQHTAASAMWGPNGAQQPLADRGCPWPSEAKNRDAKPASQTHNLSPSILLKVQHLSRKPPQSYFHLFGWLVASWAWRYLCYTEPHR